jgi:hypothetical protein
MMETEVNLTETQTELQKSSPTPIDDDEKADESKLGDEEEGFDEGSVEDDNENYEEEVEEETEMRKEVNSTVADDCDRNNEPEKILEEEENPTQQEQEATDKLNIPPLSNNPNIDSEETQSGPHCSEE